MNKNFHIGNFFLLIKFLLKILSVFRKEDGTLRTMNAEKLLKTLPALQAQLDSLLEFDCTANDLTNGVINMAFMLLFRDLIRLFACYNDGIINLLGICSHNDCFKFTDFFTELLSRLFAFKTLLD